MGMRTTGLMATVSLTLIIGVGLSACGRKAAVQPPDGKATSYGRSYPAAKILPKYVDPAAPPESPSPSTSQPPAKAPTTGNGSLYDYMPNWK